jgi:hypothetical protein
MKLTKLEQQAEALHLKLWDARARAIADENFDYVRRIEPVIAGAWWRLWRRIARRCPRPRPAAQVRNKQYVKI